MNASDVQNPNLLEQRTHNVELCMLKSMKLCDREDPDLGDGPFPLCLVGKTPGRLGDPIIYFDFFMDREHTNIAFFFNQKWGEHRDVPGISLGGCAID